MKTQLNIINPFVQNFFQVIVELNPTFLGPIKTPEERSRALWVFAGIIARFAPESLKSFASFDQTMFGEILKTSSVKRIAEVGPGSPNYSMIFPFAKLFHEQGIEMVGIGKDLVEPIAQRFRDAHIQIIQQNAGAIAGKSLNFDVIIVKNVFSYGGQTGDDEIRIINNSHVGVSNLLYHLSNHPNAIIILSEGYDVLAIDREVISQEADILCWRSWDTNNGNLYRNPNFNRIYKPYAQKVFEQSANFIVLKRKSV